jgi:hypothetical protein
MVYASSSKTSYTAFVSVLGYIAAPLTIVSVRGCTWQSANTTVGLGRYQPKEVPMWNPQSGPRQYGAANHTSCSSLI